jgi:hypothetical protein
MFIHLRVLERDDEWLPAQRGHPQSVRGQGDCTLVVKQPKKKEGETTKGDFE